MKPVFRWGLLGPGSIAERFAESLKVVDHACLVAVASRDRVRAQTFAGRFGDARAYGSYEELYSDTNVDAVYICTPHRFHFEQIKACLLAGKAVLCEKPLTVNAEECRQLFAIAHENRVFLMEAMWTPFLPVYQQLENWLADDRIGEIKMLQSSFGFTVERDPQHRLFNHDLAGGILLDMGVYNVAVSQWLMDRMPDNIKAHGFIGDTGVDEMISASLDYGDGVSSQFQCSFHSQLANEFTICGSKGRILLGSFFWEGGKITLYRDGNTESCEQGFRGRGFEYEIEHVMQCIHLGLLESPVMSGEKTLQAMTIMDQIRNQIGLAYRFE